MAVQSPIKILKTVKWNTPGKRRWYFAVSIVNLALLCGVGNVLQTAAHQDWHQVLRTTIIACVPYAAALLKVGLVFLIAWLAREKATPLITSVAEVLPEHNMLRLAIIRNCHSIYWTAIPIGAVYVFDKMLIAYIMFAIYTFHKLFSEYLADIAAGYALVSTAKVSLASEITIESGADRAIETSVTGTLLEVGLFYSTVQVEKRVRKIQNTKLWNCWIETETNISMGTEPRN